MVCKNGNYYCCYLSVVLCPAKKKGVRMQIDLRDHFKTEITEEHKDGSATLTVEYDGDFRSALRDIYNRQRCTKKLVKTFVMDGIDAALERHTKGGQDG